MDTYAQALTLLDAHYPHILAWERIVLSYRVVEYCKTTDTPTPVDALGLDEIMSAIDVWWLRRLGVV